MNYGFTGTRNGMTKPQLAAVCELLLANGGNNTWQFHHGACVGADSQAALEAYGLNWDVIAHPGKSAHGGDNQFLCPIALEHSCEVLETKTHFARNRDIVVACDLLIACPPYQTPITKETQGGTAYTVNEARKRGKPVCIVWPDGTTTRE